MIQDLKGVRDGLLLAGTVLCLAGAVATATAVADPIPDPAASMYNRAPSM